MTRNADGTYTMTKIDLIKFVREITSLGLKEAKDAAEDFLLLETLTPSERQDYYKLRQLVANHPELRGAIERKLLNPPAL